MDILKKEQEEEEAGVGGQLRSQIVVANHLYFKKAHCCRSGWGTFSRESQALQENSCLEVANEYGQLLASSADDVCKLMIV